MTRSRAGIRRFRLVLVITVLAAVGFARPGAGATVALPETGQTACYDGTGAPVACSGTGQDGDVRAGIQWPAYRFHDNGDGTITDNLTGLMWLRDGQCLGLDYWTAIMAAAADFNQNSGTYGCTDYTGTYGDWRVPNLQELLSLVHLGADEADCGSGIPCTTVGEWLNSQGFVSVADYYYWTSTPLMTATDRAYMVDTSSGEWTDGIKGGAVQSNGRMLLVRGVSRGPASLWKTGSTTCYDASGNSISCTGTGQDGETQAGTAWPSPRFTQNADPNNWVQDNLTGLIWGPTLETPTVGTCTGGTMTWQAALDYVSCLNSVPYLGVSDWRVPNRRELESLFDFGNTNPPLPSGHPFTINSISEVWSSTTTFDLDRYDSAYYVNIWSSGGSGYVGKGVAKGVLPVRGGDGLSGSADLSLTLADSDDPVIVGDTFTYSITLTNNGPDTATNVVIENNLPAGVQYQSATGPGSCTEADGTVFCNVGFLTNGNGATVTLTVLATAEGLFTNHASVTTTAVDPVSGNNAATEDTLIYQPTDLAVTLTDAPDPLEVGQNITYTATVTNNGPVEAVNVVLQDPVPTGVSLVSANTSQGSCTTGSTVTCSLGNLANGATATVTIVVTTNNIGQIPNTVSVSSNNTDTDTLNNSDSVTTVVTGQADISVTMWDSPDPVLLYENITYTITVTNNNAPGRDTATGVVLTNNLPSSTSFQSYTASQGSCSELSRVVTCNLGSLGLGSAATITIVAKSTGLGTIKDTASVTADNTDPNTANNSAEELTTVQLPVDLAVTQTDAPDPVPVGDNITYTITVTNNGPGSESRVSIVDTLPTAPAVSFVSATPPAGGTCSNNYNTVTCDYYGTVSSGQTLEFVVVATAGNIGTHTNSVTVSGNGMDSDSANNSVSETTTVTPPPSADLSVSMVDSPDPVIPGGSLTYTITVENIGTVTANSARLTDYVEDYDQVYVSATPDQGTCSHVSGEGPSYVDCDLGDIAAGATATVVIEVTAPGLSSAWVPGTISNQATVYMSGTDYNGTNNSSTAETQVYWPVMIGSASYGTLQEALDAAGNGDVLKTVGGHVFSEAVVFNRPGVTVVLQGGWNQGYSAGGGAASVIHGGLTIVNGTVYTDGVVVE